MSALVANLIQAIRLRGVFPTRVIVRTVRQNLVAYAAARVALRACDRVGLRARTFGRPKLVNHGEIRIGDDFAVGGALGPVHIATGPSGVVTIGDDVAIDYGTSISARTHVSLGSGVRIGPYCIISDTDLPLPLDLSEDDDARAIVLGEDVRLGARVTIRPGVKIGERAVVTAGSVVTSDVPDDAVASGNPASVVRIAPRQYQTSMR
jgi:acetyltransferase-like isoleucine patch superfamily enzyme